MRGAGQGAVTQAGDDGEGDVGETADSKAAEENGLEVNRDRNGGEWSSLKPTQFGA